jgi:hypothetical protein
MQAFSGILTARIARRVDMVRIYLNKLKFLLFSLTNSQRTETEIWTAPFVATKWRSYTMDLPPFLL